MMIKKLIIGATTLTALCSLAFADETTPSHSDIKINADTVLTTKKYNEEDKATPYSINALLPQINGKNLSAGAKSFNQKLNDVISNASTQFKMQIVNPTDRDIPTEALKNTLDIDYKPIIFQAGDETLASVTLYELASFAGTAHPMHTIETINFDLTKGSEIQLADLFKPNSNYLKIIGNYCNKALKKNIPDADKQMIDDGTKPDAKNFANWNLTPKGLLITFNEYQVAAYVYGTPEVTIPYTELQTVLSPTATVAICAKTPSVCK